MRIELTGGQLKRVNSIVGGDSLTFTIRRTAYPASLWTAKFALSNEGSTAGEFDGSASGDDFSFDIPGSWTNALTPARMQAWLVFTEIADDTNRATEDCGLLTVQPNPLGVLAPSLAQLMLNALNEAMSILVSQAEQSASFNGQSYTLQNMTELKTMRDHLIAEVGAEQKRLGIGLQKGQARTIRTRFL